MTLPVVFLYTCFGLLAKFVFGNYAIDKSSAASSLVTTVMEDFRPQVINNQSISGVTMACRHTLPYFVNSNIQYEMCVAQTDEYLKSGDSIIGIIRARNFMPTCRSLQMLLWMHSQIHESNGHRNYAIDVGANIGTCTMHMASLGYYVYAVEPVREHISIIQGSLKMNPTFPVHLYQGGAGEADKIIFGKISHGDSNWGGSKIEIVGGDSAKDGNAAQIDIFSLDSIIGTKKRITMLKIDCEGCEYGALKGAVNSFSKIAMIKFELNQKEYKAGNETISAKNMLKFVEEKNYELFVDQFTEMGLFHGGKAKTVLDVDRLFGSKKFGLGVDESFIHGYAKKVLKASIKVDEFDYESFAKNADMDVIAIQKKLAYLMKVKWFAN